DLQNMHDADMMVRRALADEIRDACINVGFFYVKHHGIPEETISRALAAGKRFFALPDHAKAALDIHKSSNFKGYTALLGENTDPENRGDLHEEDPSGAARSDDGAMTGENVWPENLPGFRQDVLDY
ncbi:hypothetical protein PHLCEN_2v12122, partial [Hermanssonia centrifuga]